jgi:hypothetical protein
MHLVGIDLTFVARSSIAKAVSFHGQPVVTRSQDFLGHYMPIGVGAEGPFMDFFDKHVRFAFVHTPK